MYFFFFGNELINNNVYVVTKQQRNYMKLFCINFVKLHCKTKEVRIKKKQTKRNFSISRATHGDYNSFRQNSKQNCVVFFCIFKNSEFKCKKNLLKIE